MAWHWQLKQAYSGPSSGDARFLGTPWPEQLFVASMSCLAVLKQGEMTPFGSGESDGEAGSSDGGVSSVGETGESDSTASAGGASRLGRRFGEV